MEDHDVKTYFEALELSIDDVFWHSLTWATKKNPGWLGYIGDHTTQLYRDYNNHYKPTSIMESNKGFFRGSHGK